MTAVSFSRSCPTPTDRQATQCVLLQWLYDTADLMCSNNAAACRSQCQIYSRPRSPSLSATLKCQNRYETETGERLRPIIGFGRRVKPWDEDQTTMSNCSDGRDDKLQIRWDSHMPDRQQTETDRAREKDKNKEKERQSDWEIALSTFITQAAFAYRNCALRCTQL